MWRFNFVFLPAAWTHWNLSITNFADHIKRLQWPTVWGLRCSRAVIISGAGGNQLITSYKALCTTDATDTAAASAWRHGWRLPSTSTSLIISCSSLSVGFWPSDLIIVPNSLELIVPSPFLSNRPNASRNSAQHRLYIGRPTSPGGTQRRIDAQRQTRRHNVAQIKQYHFTYISFLWQNK